MLLPLALDRRTRRLEARAQHRWRRSRLARFADLVELLVQREHFFEQCCRHLSSAAACRVLLRPDAGQTFDCEQMLDARDRVTQGAIRVVQVRRSFEARQPLGRRGVVVVVRMELATELAEPALEILRVNGELARQPEEREVVAVSPEGENAAAVRAEVLVDRSAGATAAA